MTYETFEAACLWCIYGMGTFCVLLIILTETIDLIDRVEDAFNNRSN